MKRRNLEVAWLLTLVLVAMACAPAQASVLSNLFTAVTDQAHEVGVGPAYWYPVTGGADLDTQMVNVSVKVTDDVGPLCPTNKGELWPWTKASFRVEFPFGTSDTRFIEPKGLGVSERVQIGMIGGAPIVFGGGYLTQGGLAVFTSIDLASWSR